MKIVASTTLAALVWSLVSALDLGTKSCIPQKGAFHNAQSKDYFRCTFNERTEDWISFKCLDRGFVSYSIPENVLYYEMLNNAKSVHSLTTHVTCWTQATNDKPSRQVAHADLYIPIWPHTIKKEFYAGLNRPCDLNGPDGLKLVVESYTMSDAAYHDCMAHPTAPRNFPGPVAPEDVGRR